MNSLSLCHFVKALHHTTPTFVWQANHQWRKEDASQSTSHCLAHGTSECEPGIGLLVHNDNLAAVPEDCRKGIRLQSLGVEVEGMSHS